MAKKATSKKKTPAAKKPTLKKVTKKPTAKKTAVAPEITIKPTKSTKTPQVLRGFKDILPVDQRYWEQVRKTFRTFSRHYSFDRIDLPVLEDSSLFVRAVGFDTDVVQKEMFTFPDRSGELVSMRPEATASVVRAYINHGMLNLPQPVKLGYIGPMFRYERPQSGRYRQFHQFGYEVIGEKSPVIDAQLIVMAYHFLKTLGIETVMQVNSLGTPEDRKVYKQKLVAYFKTQQKYMDEGDKERLKNNPLRLLDSKDEKMMAIREDAPQILDYLSDASKKHLTTVLEYLDELDIPYELNQFLVRGLDYYTDTVFEIWSEKGEKGSQSALGGGGRYDRLVEVLGGREETPAAGFAIGIERVILKMKELELEIEDSFKPDILMAQLGETPRRKAMEIFEDMRQAGLKVIEAFAKDNLKQQLDIANKRGVKYTIILGAQELHDGVVLVRDMDGGVQETVPIEKIVKDMKKRFPAG